MPTPPEFLTHVSEEKSLSRPSPPSPTFSPSLDTASKQSPIQPNLVTSSSISPSTPPPPPPPWSSSSSDPLPPVNSDPLKSNSMYQLEPNWKPIRSKKGTIYYFNQVTFETRWQAPSIQGQAITPSTSGSGSQLTTTPSSLLNTNLISSPKKVISSVPILNNAPSKSQNEQQKEQQQQQQQQQQHVLQPLPPPPPPSRKSNLGTTEIAKVPSLSLVSSTNVNPIPLKVENLRSTPKSHSHSELLATNCSETNPPSSVDFPLTVVESVPFQVLEPGEKKHALNSLPSSASPALPPRTHPLLPVQQQQQQQRQQEPTPPTTTSSSPTSPEFKFTEEQAQLSSSLSSSSSSQKFSFSLRAKDLKKMESLPKATSSTFPTAFHTPTVANPPPLTNVVQEANPTLMVASIEKPVISTSSSSLSVSSTGSGHTARKKFSLLPPLSFLPFLFGDSFSSFLVSEDKKEEVVDTSLSQAKEDRTKSIVTPQNSPLPGSFIPSTPPDSTFRLIPQIQPNPSSDVSSKKNLFSTPPPTSSKSENTTYTNPIYTPTSTTLPDSSTVAVSETSTKQDSTPTKSGFTRFFKTPKPTTSSSSSDPSLLSTSFTIPSTSSSTSTATTTFSSSTFSSSSSSSSSSSASPHPPMPNSSRHSSDAHVFGGSLSHLVIDDTLPPFVHDCLTLLDTKGKEVQGLYRISGNAASIQRVKQQCMEHHPVELEALDIHVVSGAFKLFLRELKEPVMTFALYTEFVQAGKLRAPDARLSRLDALVKQLPRSHRVMLVHLLRHLHRLAKSPETTKMDATNLSIVFGPNLLRPQVETMDIILNADAQNLVVKDLILEAERLSPGWLS